MMTDRPLRFPPGFVCGVATSSFQIEGAWNEDGKGERIWDRFAHTPGCIKDAATGEVACDHYHRWEQDVEIMKSLGVHAYRFSISWPRVLPEGSGSPNHKGLGFYDRLVDGLLNAGIEPYATLYHWDLPQRLQERGGWPARATAEAFTEYTEVVTGALGDRIRRWITVNEPSVVADHGYLTGIHAPGRRDRDEYFRAAHHLLLAHGWSVPLIRRKSPSARVGIALNLPLQTSLSNDSGDRLAARFADGRSWASTTTAATSSASRSWIHTSRRGDTPRWAGRSFRRGSPRCCNASIGSTRSGPTWSRRTAPPMPTWSTKKGGWPTRSRYIDAYLEAILVALESGVPVMGNFVWSLLDNFEWAEGHTKRFGLVYVDFANQTRVIKDSGRWYRKVASTNMLPAGEPVRQE